MIDNFVVYDLDTGKILSYMVCNDDFEMPEEFMHGVLRGTHNAESKYVDVETLEVLERPDSPATIDKTEFSADGVDSVSISSIPAGATVRITGHGEWQVDDGTFEFSTDTPGLYLMTVDSFPEKKKEFTINAS